MQTAIATVYLSGTLNEKLDAIAASRFKGVELFENDLLSFDGTPAEVGRQIKGSDSTGKLGAVGFCFGGGIVNRLALRMGSDLAAGVPFYGVQPNAADTAKIKAPINAQYGELDTRITDGWPAFDAALTQANVPHEGHIYKGANHGFHNDTPPPVTTKPPPRRHGSTRWSGSTNIRGPKHLSPANSVQVLWVCAGQRPVWGRLPPVAKISYRLLSNRCNRRRASVNAAKRSSARSIACTMSRAL
jgi:hypothetical protein